MEKEIAQEVKVNSKLRFLRESDLFNRANYINELSGDEVVEILKVRLNMVNIHVNYKNDLTKKRLCPHCRQQKDTTEHLVMCLSFEYKREWTEEDVKQTDANCWTELIKTVWRNIELR